MKLYYYRGACSLVVRIILNEPRTAYTQLSHYFERINNRASVVAAREQEHL